MRKYKPEYDTWDIVNNFICEEDNRLCEVFDEGIRAFWYDIDDTRSISCSMPLGIAQYNKRAYNRIFKKKGIHPYMKIRLVNTKDNKVIGVCRLSIYTPKYFTGFNENIKLDKELINIIMTKLNSKKINIHQSGSEITVWEDMISRFNKELAVYETKRHIPNIKIPDYTKLLDE